MAIQYGMSEQTAAARATINRVLGARTRSVRRRVKRAAKKVRKVARAVRRVARGVKKLRKGSAAAKAHMARLRKMRRK